MATDREHDIGKNQGRDERRNQEPEGPQGPERREQLERELEQRHQQMELALARLHDQGRGNSEEARLLEGKLRDFERKRKVSWSEVSESVLAELKEWLDRDP